VEIDSFLKELISHIRQVFERPDCPVEVISHVPKFHLDIDSAIPLGLLINELLTNAYKYAFRERTNGRISIRIDDLGNGTYYFCFADDGVGLPENFDFTRSNTLGMKLIRQLSRQLAGSIVYKYEEGSKFELTFKNLESRSRML
jgi:two-component sensor histidine kinase